MIRKRIAYALTTLFFYSISFASSEPTDETDLNEAFEGLPLEIKKELIALSQLEDYRTLEGYKNMREEVRKCAQKQVSETDRMWHWMALTSFKMKRDIDQGDLEGATRFADLQIEYFTSRYEEGMNIGDEQEMATRTYLMLKEYENQAVDTTAANARLFQNETTKSTNPDAEAMTEAAVVSP